MTPPDAGSRRWLVVAGLSAWSAVAMGATIASLGVFVEPVRADAGWSAEEISRALTAFVLAMTLVMPAAGAALDRAGPRLVMTCGILALAASYLVASGAHELGTFAGCLAVAGFGLGASTYLACTVVISEWIPVERRGLAMGILLGTAAVGASAGPLVVAPAIALLGWRTAFAAIAAIVLACGLVAVFTLVAPGPHRAALAAGAGDRGPSLGALLRRRDFRLVTAVLSLSQLSFYGVYFHLVPFLVSRGFDAGRAVLLYGLSSLATLIGSFTIGPLADRRGPRAALLAALAVLAASYALVPAIGAGPGGLLAAVLFALAWGSVVSAPMQVAPIALAAATRDGSLGRMLGLGNFTAGLVAAAGPAITGSLHEATGGYAAAFAVAAAIAALSILPAALLGRPERAGRLSAAARGFDRGT